MKIHPTAIVDPQAELDESVEVQAFTIIGPHVRIGANTIVGPHCVLDGRTVIGERNHFFSGAQIGILSQDLKHRPDLIGRTTIGNDNLFREHVTVSACTLTSRDEEHRVTSIGNHCMFMAYTHVAHDCHVGDGVIMANCASLAGHVEVEDKAILGGLSGVHQECVVGRMAFVGGLSRVARDVPPYMIVDGNPARCCGPNSVGLKRNGLDAAQRARIKAMYKIMFRSNLNTTQAIHEIEASVEDSEERTCFLEFVRRSLRGITK
ncbi:MAG TPA: acyl-ACP--UDP-N-acetylglucosamine O-acyltransferase [Candidatus Hydrogenedentes bacterium]|nr:acyl-ACP--UDP-N-acetylglucosamine O-acyltransferase [Candidatus Hydrogenedentota bacterium]HOV75951.1 acyl-ACP--UDP-N-acetylglucosamine O-acyltransferase [Candidatus Hydrogenedentota bacterium]HPC17866.1 acyl-ACP--UDP-N-acetylglucosamine O-acyltransferase [Candidatus Hydrogenedentota bacterium]HRT20596.1 acyl-ACP--UDP-N-acetylglucosamine O-acyltransferase [Candidatus Hydrogenedentota bacterium]HRT65397.1 acyl-ACP--UDP-N-acetylglucosamine O-acyltransferase [Candidatus Hydrogenedentota bacteri